MEHNKLAIVAFPRSGTKLLSSIFEKRGHYNFGEFFDVYSNNIEYGELPYAKRKTVEDQKDARYYAERMGKSRHSYSMFMDTKNRLELFENNYNKVDKSIVTIWPENLYMVPEIMDEMNETFFLCPYRNNKYEQLLSRLITYHNLNYNGEIKSKPILVDLEMLDYFYYQFVSTENLQKTLVDSGRGKYINFDELIIGESDLGFAYEVQTQDQHKELEQYIINLGEVKKPIYKFRSLI